MGHSPITADWLDKVTDDIDLRKRHTNTLTDQLVHRAHWLEKDDQSLIIAMFRDGQSASQIAKLIGQDPRHVRRRIKRLVHRLNDPRVAYVVEHCEAWSRSKRAIAQSLFIQGHSIREVTENLGVSFYSVRKHREAINAMSQANAQANTRSSKLRAWR